MNAEHIRNETFARVVGADEVLDEVELRAGVRDPHELQAEIGEREVVAGAQRQAAARQTRQHRHAALEHRRAASRLAAERAARARAQQPVKKEARAERHVLLARRVVAERRPVRRLEQRRDGDRGAVAQETPERTRRPERGRLHQQHERHPLVVLCARRTWSRRKERERR